MKQVFKTKIGSGIIVLILLSLIKFNVYSQTQINPSPPSYSGPIHYTSDRFVAANTTVIFNNATVTLDSNVVIIVEKGATLQIYNSTFTSTVSSQHWQGIHVLGDTTKDQTEQIGPNTVLSHFQGKLIMRNSTIKYAMMGVSVGTLNQITGEQTDGGGIFRAINCNFVDCWNAASVFRYSWYTHNMCYFRSCDFRWESYMGINPFNRGYATLVGLSQNQGVFFMGCQFRNTNTWDSINNQISDGILDNVNNTDIKGVGLYALNASYTLKPAGTCYQATNNDTGCIRCTGTYNLFTGLGTGIVHHSLNPYIDIKGAITGCDFINNVFGIKSYTSKNLFINRCNFKVNNDYYEIHSAVYEEYNKYQEVEFIVMDSCHAYDISANDLNVTYTTNFPTVQYHHQIVINYSDSIKSRIYKNAQYSEKSDNGTCYQFYGVLNRFSGKNTGLEVECNTYNIGMQSATSNLCRYDCDWYFPSGYTNKFKNQSLISKSQRNTWSNLPYCGGLFHPANVNAESLNDTFSLFYHAGAGDMPSCVEGTHKGKIKVTADTSNSQNCYEASYCRQFGTYTGVMGTVPSTTSDSLSLVGAWEDYDNDFEDNYIDAPLSMNDPVEPETKILAWPVPVSDQLHINIENSPKITRAEVIDLTGRVINIPYIQNGNTIILNTENLPNGYMITRLYSNKATFTIKFVKQ